MQEIQLSWQNLETGEPQEFLSFAPVAIGRKSEKMPEKYQGQSVSHLLLDNSKVSSFHALIICENNLWRVDDHSKNGILVNNKRVQQSHILHNGDWLKIGSYKITVTFDDNQITQTSFLEEEETISSTTSILLESDEESATTSSILLESDEDATESITHQFSNPAQFFVQHFIQSEYVSLIDLYRTGIGIDETEYVALGGGIGSFTFVDTLRICGVKSEQIWVLGINNKPYSRYQTLCLNSQIRPHNRLRSGSDSCPDNIWGFPGYALREAGKNLAQGKLNKGLKYLWQVFSEPIFADTYTPVSQNVFDSMEKEAKRIGWDKMWRYGRIRYIRKTTDGRYAILYSVSNDQEQNYRLLIAKYVHLSTGYSSIRFLPTLQAYREETEDFQSVVNAYENHEHIYQHLQYHGGTIIIRGGGIVASRIMERLNEIRYVNPQITIIHLLRTPKSQGNKVGLAQRQVENHWEFQPYNWPKATWGGDMRVQLENALPQERAKLLSHNVWGGTTTANRTDWRKIVKKGDQEKWYLLQFGEVEKVIPNPNYEQKEGKLMVYFFDQNTGQRQHQIADFIIDATGLEAKPQFQPFLKDLINCYRLPLNPLQRLDVTKDFKLKGMDNNQGRMFASGIITLGGPYAPVDTFLGLQYTAQRAIENLIEEKAPGLKYLEGFRSLNQWLKWAFNHRP